MDHIEHVLIRQREAFDRQGAPDLSHRLAALVRLRKAILAYRRDIARAISEDFSHRSAHETDILELLPSLHAIDYLRRNLRRFVRPEPRRVALIHRPGRAWVAYQPKGVVGVMAPWNYPVQLALVPLATALAAGNRVMLKPSELTPKTSALLHELLDGVFASDEVAVILGGPETGAAFSRLPFDHLFFTGSTAIGRKVMAAAADHLVPLTLELGGKSPAIIGRGQVYHRTVEAIIFGKLSNAGQTCVAPDYALLHEGDLGAFRHACAETVARFYPDGPSSRDYSAIINDQHVQRLEAMLEDARSRGAEIVSLGRDPDRAASRAQTIAPTLVLNAPDDCALMQQEIFGPILVARTYRTIEEAIAFVNARPRPLALYYFGARDEDCSAVLSRTTSGNVCLNATMLHVAQDDLPFGGIGPSGMGAYHGPEGFRTFSHAKGVYAPGRLSPARLLHAPFGRMAALARWLTLR